MEPLPEPIEATIRLEVVRACGLQEAVKAADSWAGGEPSLAIPRQLKGCMPQSAMFQSVCAFCNAPVAPHLRFLQVPRALILLAFYSFMLSIMLLKEGKLEVGTRKGSSRSAVAEKTLL